MHRTLPVGGRLVRLQRYSQSRWPAVGTTPQGSFQPPATFRAYGSFRNCTRQNQGTAGNHEAGGFVNSAVRRCRCQGSGLGVRSTVEMVYSAIHKAAGLTVHGFFSHPFRSYPFPLFACVLACPCRRMRNHKTFRAKYLFPACSSLRNGQTCRTPFSKPKFCP